MKVEFKNILKPNPVQSIIKYSLRNKITVKNDFTNKNYLKTWCIAVLVIVSYNL